MLTTMASNSLEDSSSFSNDTLKLQKILSASGQIFTGPRSLEDQKAIEYRNLQFINMLSSSKPLKVLIGVHSEEDLITNQSKTPEPPTLLVYSPNCSFILASSTGNGEDLVLIAGFNRKQIGTKPISLLKSALLPEMMPMQGNPPFFNKEYVVPRGNQEIQFHETYQVIPAKKTELKRPPSSKTSLLSFSNIPISEKPSELKNFLNDWEDIYQRSKNGNLQNMVDIIRNMSNEYREIFSKDVIANQERIGLLDNLGKDLQNISFGDARVLMILEQIRNSYGPEVYFERLDFLREIINVNNRDNRVGQTSR